MSVGTPKSAAKEPIQLDIILVCRKTAGQSRPTVQQALESARAKLARLEQAGFALSRNDRKIVLYGQLLATLRSAAEAGEIARRVEGELGALELDAGPLFQRREP
jgi:putative DNA methylase